MGSIIFRQDSICKSDFFGDFENGQLFTVSIPRVLVVFSWLASKCHWFYSTCRHVLTKDQVVVCQGSGKNPWNSEIFKMATVHRWTMCLYSGVVSMGSMGSAEPINFLRGALEPIKFWEWKLRNWYILWSMKDKLSRLITISYLLSSLFW